MRLSCRPNVTVQPSDPGGPATAVVRFADSARDIGRHQRGILFVEFRPDDLEVVSRCRVALRADSDAVDYAAMWPDAAALLRASCGNINAEIIT